jgi:hypothetical protein
MKKAKNQGDKQPDSGRAAKEKKKGRETAEADPKKPEEKKRTWTGKMPVTHLVSLLLREQSVLCVNHSISAAKSYRFYFVVL